MTEQTFEVSSDQRYLIKINDNPVNGYHGKFTFRVEVSTSYSDELLEDAVVYVMSKHPIFRIKYFKQGTDVFQHLEPETFLRFNGNITHGRTLVEAEAAVENFVPETFSYLHRVIIYNKPPEYSCVFFAVSNTLLDPTSASIITEDIQAFLEKQQSQREESYGDFIDFVLWQNDVAKNHTLSEHAENWGRRILKSVSPINFPFDQTSSKPPGGYRSVIMTFDDTFIPASRSYCQKYGLRDSSIFLASWYIFLHEITGERDLGGGVVFDQRTSPQLERVAGPLSNILPHRIWMDDDTVLEALIMQINADLMVMEKMKHFPFSDVFTRLNEIDDDELVQFLRFRFQYIRTLNSSGTMKFPLSTGWPNTSLGLICVESESSIQLQLSYDESTIDRESAETYIAYLEGIATMLVEDPGGKLLNVRNTLFKNSTRWPPVLKEDTQNINPMVTLADLFEDQVSRTPSAVALDFEGKLFTYKQVNDRANEIAHALIKEYQIQPDDLVGVAMDRSEHLIFSILGILKAGAAYVPIDISFPISRKMEIIDDCQCKIVLVDNATDERYVLPCETRLVIDIYHLEFTNPRRTNTGDNLAYVIYSSGTTGKPKGIMVEHSPVVNLLYYYNTKYNLKQPTNIVQLTNIAVDIALQEIFSALSNGHTLFMPSSETILSKENFNLYLTNNRINFIQVIPDFLHHYLVDADVLPFLKTILCGGDKLDERLKNAIIKKGYNLYNVYGQTETVIDSLVAVCDVNSMVFTDVLPGYQVMVFDEHTQLVLPGTVGEICTAGIGLARGYLNQPELTHEKFSPAILPGKRVYRTGDRAKICGEGKLKFQGRSDRQVKIRGFRVELSEIEKCIESCQGVLKAAVTVIVNNGDKNIIAYIVSKETTAAKVLAYISLRLPDYMVPSRVEIIPAFPLLPSGKIDFKKLKTVEPVSPTGLLALPATDIQEKLSVIWMEVLSKQQIGIYDDFFQLGGHSLKIVQIISRIQNVFGVKLPFKTLFTSRTISDLSEVIAVGTQSNLNINRTPEAASYGLSYAQKRLYILQQSPGSGLNFNIPLVYTFGEGVDKDALHKVFIHLFERHESLRTCFKIIEGEPRQIVKKMPEIAFTVTTYREEDEGKVRAYIDEKVNERFDLEVAPLLRCYLIETAESKIQLLVVLHHIIADGWSIEILEKEFSILWQSNTLNKSQLLIPLKIQYRDFSTWEDQQIESSGTSHRMFWQKQFAHGVPRLNFPTYKARPSRQTFNGDNISVSIKKDLTQSIQQFSASNGNTIFITLVSLLDVLMYKYTGQKDFTYGTPVAGRYQSELESQVGYFLNILPLRTQIEPDATFLEHVTKTKGVIVDAYEHQAYPVDLLLEDLNITRDLSRSNIFDVLIILQNYYSETISVTESDIETTNFDTALNKSALFDLTFEFNEIGDSLNLNIIYNTDLFSSIQIKEMSTAFLTLIVQVISSPTVAVRTVSLPQSQKVPTSMCPLVGDASSGVGDFTLVDRFEHWTKVNPNHSAVSFKNRNISYGLLNKLANRLAWELRAQHTILPDDRIGILTSRSDHMVIAVLAVLKSGAAFVPIDNEFPIERINYIIEDCQLRALIIDDPDVGAQFSSSTIVHLLSSSEDVCESQSHNLNVRIDYHHLAYVIYTSGSTGKPKGVMIEHGNVCSAIKAWEQSYHLMDFDVKLLQLANFAFDVFVGDLCRSLCVGGTMFICPSEIKLSLPDLLKYIISQKINILEGTPALLVPLLDVAFDEGLSLDYMRVFVLGSDTCSWEDFKRIGLRFGHAMRIINSYGTTENTIDSSFYEWTPTSSSPSAIVPIGRPLLNTE
ncbi:MAG: hypothetical protein DI539_09365, partial [Flavobacterium psychrophilum]